MGLTQDTTFFPGIAGSCHDTTFLMESVVFPQKPPASSFFTSHSLKPGSIAPASMNKFQPDWLLGLFLACFVSLAWVQVFSFKRFRQVLLAPYSKRFLNQLARDGNLFNERISLALVLVYVIGMSVFLYQSSFMIFSEGLFDLSGFRFYLVCASGLVAYWLVKIGAVRILGSIFKTFQQTNEYLLNILILNSVSGVFTLPFLILAVYLKSQAFLYICLIIFSLFLLLRIYKGFLLGISISKFSYLLLFVYLCALEFLPLVIVTKIILTY
jgi:hypothetical protein